MIALTRPEASVAELWQWIHPCVCTTLEMQSPMPPTGSPSFFTSAMSGSTFFFSGVMNSTL